MKDVYGRLLVLSGLVVFSVTALHAARLTIFIDGDNRTPYDVARGKAVRIYGLVRPRADGAVV